MSVTLLSISLIPIDNVAEAGLFRDRTRFNIKADGFWMKGRCFMPGAIEIPDNYNFVVLSFLDDFGCLVKNRKGKRRIRRRKAFVSMDFALVVRSRYGGPLRTISARKSTCKHARRCRGAFEGPLPNGVPISNPPIGVPPSTSPRWAGSPIPSPTKIVGLVAKICGQKNEPDRTGTRFEVHVGKTPAGRSGVQNIVRGVSCR